MATIPWTEGGGSDHLYGEAGHDRLKGNKGDDLLSGDDGDDHLQGENGDDSLQGGAGNDTLDGGEGHDDLIGGAGRDLLDGGDGHDFLDGQDDDDTLRGGAGLDELRGGRGNDQLEGDAGDDILLGEDGADRLEGGDGRDELQGHEGNDTLFGGADRDWLVGGAGLDVLHGEAGDDRLIGGDGDDHLLGGSDQDTLEGGIGSDTLEGGAGGDRLRGESGDDVLSGDDGRDDLDGGDGHDSLLGGQGDDALLGGVGNDTLHGGADDDALVGQEGDDVLHGGEGDDLLKGNDGIDHLHGDSGADYLSGGAGNDVILGGDQDDQGYGDDGDDSLDGGSGADKLWGTALSRFAIVDLRSGSPDGTDLADIELFRFSDGDLTVSQLNYMTEVDADIAYNVENSDGSKSRIGWRPSVQDPSVVEAFIQRRTISGTLTSETVFRADGTRVAHAWDVSFEGRGETWESYTQTFDAQAELVSQVYKNDNGSFTLSQWDPADGENWNTRETTYNSQADYDAGLGSKQVDTIDAGKLGVVDYIERQWDRAGASWSTIVKELDLAMRTLIEDTAFDNGSRVVKGTDHTQDARNYRDGVNASQLPAQEWQSFEEHKDANGNRTWDTHLYYGTPEASERTIKRGWDYSGQNWTSYELRKDHLLRPTWRQDLFDNGSGTVKEWDYTGTTWLWRETHSSGNTRLWQRDQFDGQAYIYRDWTHPTLDEIETRYDSSGFHYYRHLIDGVEKTVHEWDREDGHPWVEKITTTVGGATSRVETIYGAYKTVEIYDLTGEEDWTRHVQEWRGTNLQNKVEDKFYNNTVLIKELAWDYSGRSWDHYEKKFHDQDVVYHKIVNDNDTYTVDRTDYQGAAWDTISIEGRVIGGVERASRTETLYDDGLKIIEEKDLGRENWDTRIWKSREYGGVRLDFVEGISFDTAITVDGRTFTDHLRFTDRPRANTWETVGIFAVRGQNGWSGWVDPDSGDAFSAVFTGDYVARLKSWDGLLAVVP